MKKGGHFDIFEPGRTRTFIKKRTNPCKRGYNMITQLVMYLLISYNFADFLLKTVPITVHCKWFSRVLDIYQQQTPISKNSSVHLYAFALKYLAILVKSNDLLTSLIETHTLPSMISCIKVESNLKESSIFNAYLSLLQMLNTNKRGLEYIFQEGNL